MARVRVLVVDDSPEVRARLVAMLVEVSATHIVEEAANGDDALLRIEARAPDIVFLDLHMPGKNGLSVLAALKAKPSPPVVVVLTNHPTEHYRRECMAHGADYFFDKSKHFDRAVEVLVTLGDGSDPKTSATLPS
jgi:CheY-like chemotaxis protein